MTNQNTLTPTKVESPASRLWLKLLGLFALAFAASFVLFFAYSLLSAFAEGSAENAITNQVKPIVIDPRMESELANALASENAPLPPDVNDVFVDRAGLAGKVPGFATSGLNQVMYR